VIGVGIIGVYFDETPKGRYARIRMETYLSESEERVLEGLVFAHTGDPSPDEPRPVHLDGPSEQDKKPVVVMSPSTEGLMTWFASAGDDLAPVFPASGRGEGETIDFVFTGPGTLTKTLEFSQPVEIHDGQLFYKPAEDWNPDDVFSLAVVMPPTIVTPAAEPFTGNCVLVPTGLGFNLIVPTSKGTHDVDCDQAVPVPAKRNGHWEIDRLTSKVFPAVERYGISEWMLLDIPAKSFFLKNVAMGNPMGEFDVDVYKAEWISSRWRLEIEVKRVTAGAGRVGGWLMMFREDST